uniref:Ig-like domain-containing protein n=1 Tax=Pygocentrus nattereri TaxID=42514 RepID=A0AAR2IIC4_PYGNA
MKITLSLLLILLSFSGVKCQSMESLETAVQKKPGETLSLSCRGSGFNFGGYDMHWIRQQAGKPLQWIGLIWYDASSAIYAKPAEGRTEITRQNSQNLVYLKLTGLTEQDSAVYYCARKHSGTNM